MNPEHGESDQGPGFWSSRHAIGLIVIGAVAAYFLLTEHLAHVFAALPYVLLLACPLMHVFMHRGHGHHGGHHRSAPGADKSVPPKPGEPS